MQVITAQLMKLLLEVAGEIRPRQITTVGLGRVFQKEESRVETEQSDGSLGE